MNVLILTGKFGMGHYSVALTLSKQITKAFPTANIQIEDIFEYAVPNCSETIYKAFTLLVKKGSGVYNQYYKFTENRKNHSKSLFLPYFLYKLEYLINQGNPTVIVSTLPFCSQLVSSYKQKKKKQIPLLTCITDISCHSEWISPHTDVYLVGSKSVKKGLMGKGVNAKQIIVSGIPVKEEFKQEVVLSQSQNRNLLIMGGGLGLLPTSMDFYQKINDMEQVETTVITGNNTKLYQMIYGRFPHIKVIGYTDRVYKYMREADLIVSKAGGITTFEAIFSETPLLVFQPFLQQEKENAAFILNNQIGFVLRQSKEEWLYSIRRILYSDTMQSLFRENFKAVKQQINSASIVDVLFEVENSQRSA